MIKEMPMAHLIKVSALPSAYLFTHPGSTRGSLERREPVRDPAGVPGEAWAGCASGGEEVFSSRNLFVLYLDLSLRMPPPHSPPGPLHS